MTDRHAHITSPQTASINRRRFLKLGGSALAGGALTAALPGSAFAATKARKPQWPTGQLPASAASNVDASQFFSTSQLAAYGQEANLLGLRTCGSAKHDAYIRTLARRFYEAGLTNVHLEPVPLARWEATHWSLTAGGTTYPYTFYMPYTQDTGSSGITAPMVLVENENTDLKGKIAVFQLGAGSIPYAELAAISQPGAIYDPNHQIDIAGSYVRPWVAIAGIQSTLDDYLKRGAVGFIGILTNREGPDKIQQYTPYDARLRSAPGIWLDSSGGATLAEQAAAGANATIVLQTQQQNVMTHNLVAFIPGTSDELTVLHTHTDGTNGMEENGQIPVLAAAQYMARLPRSALERTVMIMLSSGHFAGGVGIRNYIQQHQADTLPKIKSILTLEHVGCLEVAPNTTGQLELTGKPELAAWFGADAPGLASAMINHEHRDGLSGTVTRPEPAAAPTYYPQQPVQKSTGWPGEGTYWWWYAGLTAGNQITGPWDLLTANQDITGLVDYDLMRTDAISTVEAITQLNGTSSAELTALAV